MNIAGWVFVVIPWIDQCVEEEQQNQEEEELCFRETNEKKTNLRYFGF